MKKALKAFFITSLVFAGFMNFSCASWLQGKVDMDTNTNPVSIADLFIRNKDLDSLETPAQLYATQALYSGKIILTWEEVAYATSYSVERAVVKTANSDGTYPLPDESDYCSGQAIL